MSHITKQHPLFGAQAEITLLDAEEEFAKDAIQESFELGVRLQSIFNLYDPKSELSALNKKRELKVSQELLQVITLALEFCKKTNGAYDITHGKQFLQRKQGKELTPLHTSYKDVIIEGNLVRLQHPDILLDLGSIAKGYIAKRMAEHLEEFGVEQGYVDARGDLQCIGEITINIQHPRKEGHIGTITLENKGVATSGDYKQFHKSFSNSHILGKTNIISATVIADDVTIADVYATLLMVCNDDIKEKIMQKEDISAMTIDDALNIKYYNEFEEYIV